MFRTWPAHEDKIGPSSRSGCRALPSASCRMLSTSRSSALRPAGMNIASCGTAEDSSLGSMPQPASSTRTAALATGSTSRECKPTSCASAMICPSGLTFHDAGASGLYGMHLFRQAFLACRKGRGNHLLRHRSRSHEPAPVDHHQTLKNLIGGVTEPYGDFLMSLDKDIPRSASTTRASRAISAPASPIP